LDVFWGLEYRIVGSKVTFDTSETIPGLNLPSRDFRTAGLGFALLFDSRNNTFTPDRGLLLKAQLAQEASPFWDYPFRCGVGFRSPGATSLHTGSLSLTPVT
jgi:hypothetical protein